MEYLELFVFIIVVVMSLGASLWASLFAYRALHFESVRWLWRLWGINLVIYVMSAFGHQNATAFSGSIASLATLCFSIAYLLVAALLLADAAAFVLKERPEIRLPIGQWIAPLRHAGRFIGGVAVLCAVAGYVSLLPDGDGNGVEGGGSVLLGWAENTVWFIGIVGGLLVSWEAWRRLGFRSVLWFWALFAASTLTMKLLQTGWVAQRSSGVASHTAMCLWIVVLLLGTWLVYADALAFVRRVRPELRSAFFPFFGWLQRNINALGPVLLLLFGLAAGVLLGGGKRDAAGKSRLEEKKTDFSEEKTVP